MTETKSIKNWAEDERPREKMLQKGASALTDAELLAILISSGTRERSALDLARDVLELANRDIAGIGRISITELRKIKGIGEARAITICAAMEIGRRRQTSEGLNSKIVMRSKDAVKIVQPLLQDLHHEAFCVVYLNHAQKYLKHEIISEGGITATTVDIRIVLKNCLLYNANKLIMAHNHPSGNKQPSEADKVLTKRLKEAAKIMDIELMDHLIIAGNDYLSLADEGYM